MDGEANQSLAHGRPNSGPSAEDVRNIAKSYSEKIFMNWQLLYKMLERYEGVIQRRWVSMDTGQRKQVLLTAYPNMPVHHRPDFVAWCGWHWEEADLLPAADRKSRDAFLLPCLNQEDLLQEYSLLLFLYVRSREHPNAFAAKDMEGTHLGTNLHVLRPGFLENYPMFTGWLTHETFGELALYDPYPEVSGTVRLTSRIRDPGFGLILLEAQDRIYSILAECCRLILDHIPNETLMDPSLLEAPMPEIFRPPKLDSVAFVKKEAPYRLRASLELNRLHSIILNEFWTCEDNMWSLRENPAYFSQALAEYKNHQYECTPDGRYILSDWRRVLGSYLVFEYGMLEVWGVLSEQVAYLEVLHAKYEAEIRLERPLPREYHQAFQQLLYSLDRFSERLTHQTFTAFFASPSMRCCKPCAWDSSGKLRRCIGPERSSSPLDRVAWFFESLKIAEPNYPGHYLDMFTDMLDRFLSFDPQAQRLISPYVADLLPPLLALNTCRAYIEQFHPWAISIRLSMSAEGRQAEMAERFTAATPFMKGFLEDRIIELPDVVANLGDPSLVDLSYPADLERTHQNTDTMRRAEFNLNKFWKRVDRHTKTDMGPGLRDLLARRASQRTALQNKNAKSSPPTSLPASPTTAGQPANQVFSPPDRGVSKTELLANQPKVKIKTRKGGPSSEEPAAEDTPDENEPPQSPVERKFLVDQRALNVFNTLFYQPDGRPANQVPWREFMHAMQSVGFTAETNGGSMWVFTPQWEGPRITIHEPHPVNKLSLDQAKKAGRRLAKTYGWHGGLFELRH
ncbi:hypothetical protein EJ06DRAFT_379784 [Trichodelitschia bisporula]|uniref:Uncharacterized protein n=1 Tax=Trichodelitschia bisporula TaxID=703511 RepID=A0A6G1HYN3_9PEZI|nr:hypothetical protein EJ06DRAFT_379784 [Trichodelitschia bisporula]